MVELFQNVAHTVGEQLGRPVVSYANGRYMVITFAGSDDEPAGRAQILAGDPL